MNVGFIDSSIKNISGMEAATLKKKTAGLSKGKLKKTIKNVLCRPDSIHWPVVSEENERNISIALSKYKVDIPEFKKLQWNVLKKIPKEDRPKPPPVKKPDGLIFGLRHCFEAVRNKDCSALLIDSEVNPKSIVQPVIEACITANVPVVCSKTLKELSVSNFGFKTICLGIKQGCLEEISKKISELANTNTAKPIKTIHTEAFTIDTVPQDIEMSDSTNNTEITNYLLKRTSKKCRVFVPPSDAGAKEVKKKFIGQDFINFTGRPNKADKNTNEDWNAKHTYKNMKLKRIMNNPNRVQMGKKRKTENAKL